MKDKVIKFNNNVTIKDFEEICERYRTRMRFLSSIFFNENSADDKKLKAFVLFERWLPLYLSLSQVYTNHLTIASQKIQFEQGGIVSTRTHENEPIITRNKDEKRP